MTPERYILKYGEREIRYEIVRRPRKTIEIAVEPDASVVIVAPPETGIETIEAMLRKRAVWVIRQQRHFSQFLPRTPERRFISGETHLYLGRQYRLRVVQDVQDSVILIRGFMIVHTRRPKNSDVIRNLVESWYRTRAREKFAERVEVCLKLFPNPERFRPNSLTVRKTSKRWGSMNPDGSLMLNTRLVQAPTDGIDYVIVHELCHMIEPHHGKAFFDLLAKAMPDWQNRKQRLERTMA